MRLNAWFFVCALLMLSSASAADCPQKLSWYSRWFGTKESVQGSDLVANFATKVPIGNFLATDLRNRSWIVSIEIEKESNLIRIEALPALYGLIYTLSQPVRFVFKPETQEKIGVRRSVRNGVLSLSFRANRREKIKLKTWAGQQGAAAIAEMTLSSGRNSVSLSSFSVFHGPKPSE